MNFIWWLGMNKQEIFGLKDCNIWSMFIHRNDDNMLLMKQSQIEIDGFNEEGNFFLVGFWAIFVRRIKIDPER